MRLGIQTPQSSISTTGGAHSPPSDVVSTFDMQIRVSLTVRELLRILKSEVKDRRDDQPASAADDNAAPATKAAPSRRQHRPSPWACSVFPLRVGSESGTTR